MLIVPLLVGAWLVGFEPPLELLGLAGGSLLGYLGVATGASSARSRGPARRRLRRWTGAYLIAGLALLFFPLIREPKLLLLGLLLAPALASEVVHLRLRRERALLNGALSILGFSLLTPACFLLSDGSLALRPDGIAWAGVLSFFWGSLLFVKANLRGRRDVRLRAGGVLFHVLVLFAFWTIRPALGLAFLPSLLRLGLLAHPRPRPLVIGLTEIANALLFTALFLAAFRG